MDDFVHIPIRVPAAFAARIDEYWHTHRLMSRAAAVRVLLTWALDTSEAQQQVRQYKHDDQRADHLHGKDNADRGADQEP
jgi:hypothetical protein